MRSHLNPLIDRDTTMGLVMQGMIVVTGAIGIFLNLEKALHIILKSSSRDILMASVTIALRDVEVTLMRLHLVARESGSQARC